MMLTYLERQVLTALKNNSRTYEKIASRSRSGAVGSVVKKGLAVYQKKRHVFKFSDGSRMWDTSKKLVISRKGLKALKEPPPKAQRASYGKTQGLRKLHGLNSVRLSWRR